MSIIHRFITTFLAESGDIIPTPGEVGSVTALNLINANTDALIGGVLTNGSEIDISGVPISITANTTGTIGSLEWKIDGCEINVSNHSTHKILPNRMGPYGAIETLAINLVNDLVKTRAAKVAELREFIRTTSVTRPFNYGEGIRTLEVTPYSGPDKTGTRGTTYSIEVEFNSGTSLGFTPSEFNVNTMNDLATALASANHYDKIFVAPGVYATQNLNISKRVKIIGAGSGQTSFTGFGVWTITTGCTLQGFSLSGNEGQTFYCPFGVDGLFISDIKAYGKTNFFDNNGNDTNGLVVDNVLIQDFRGTKCEPFEMVNSNCNNISIRNTNINNTKSITKGSLAAGRCQGIRIGSVPQTPTNTDIILYNVKIDRVESEDPGNAEVHGFYLFGTHNYVEKCWVKNIVPKATTQEAGGYRTDRESGGGKMKNSLLIDNWFHNCGASRQEGGWNLKGEADAGENILLNALITDDNTVNFNGTTYSDAYKGWAINAHNRVIVFGCKVVRGQTNTGFGLANLFGETQVWGCNEMCVKEDKFLRVTNKPENGPGELYAGDNFGSIYNRDGESSFYTGNQGPEDFEIIIGKADTFCPASSANNAGAGCDPRFSLPNWCENDKLN